MGLLLVFVGSEKTGSTSGICAGAGRAGHCITHLVIRIYRWGMLLSLGLSWLPRRHMLLVGNVQHCGMGLPGPASCRFRLHLPVKVSITTWH